MGSRYDEMTPASRALFLRAKEVFAGGVNHNARKYDPYPLFVSKAKGKYIWDADGNRFVDYWLGHMALILGHSPKVVVDAVKDQIGNGTHFGMGSELSVELGEEIARAVPSAEMMRFCNTGAEATMYLVRLARGYTRKRTIIKMTGGWHGYNTDLNKGVHQPYDKPEGAGILEEEQAHVVSVKFNDLGEASSALNANKGDVAAVFLEPILGAGGCIPADKDYLRGLRELADAHGTLLAFDEIITGFRLALGGAQEWYGVKPDLTSLGKIIGGGLPIGLVCGLRDVVSMADPSKKGGYVSIGGGTFSENPLTMSAGLATLRYLRRNRTTVYPRLNSLGEKLRKGVDSSLRESEVEAHTTGAGSLFLTHFGVAPERAEDLATEDTRTSKEYALWLITKGIFVLPGHPGTLSTAHTTEDVRRFIEESRSLGEQLASTRKNRQKSKIGKD